MVRRRATAAAVTGDSAVKEKPTGQSLELPTLCSAITPIRVSGALAAGIEALEED
jgi:hypothetical protein